MMVEKPIKEGSGTPRRKKGDTERKEDENVREQFEGRKTVEKRVGGALSV